MMAACKQHRPAILFISALDLWSLGHKKGGVALWRTLTGYAKRGWRVYFVTGNQASHLLDSQIDGIAILRFDAPFLKRMMRVRKLGFLARIVWWLWFQIMAFKIALSLGRQVKFSVIYGYEIYGIPVAKLLSMLWKVPMVSRFQGTSFGVFWSKKPFYKIRAWEHYVALKIPADLVIMTDDGTQGDQVLRQLGVEQQKVRFWMNGLDWDKFDFLPDQVVAKRQLGLQGRKILLCVSRLVKWKRVDRSIRALPEVVKKHPDVMLVIVGDGPERDALQQLAETLGVASFVRFEGAVPHDEVPLYMAAADIFLSLYDWSNVGNPLLEAMAAGRCIIALNNGDTGKIIRHGWTGVLIDNHNLHDLPEIINKLLLDEKKRLWLGMNARKYAKAHFWSWEERLHKEINEVCKLITR